MKLKIGNKVYLQKYEVADLMHNLNSFPGSVLDEIFSDGKDSFFFMNGPTDGFRFESVFKNPASVKWLMEQDWIVDYDEYAEMPLPELEALVERLNAEYNTGVEEFNAKDETYREKHFDEKCDEFYKADHKISSLEELVSARKSEATFVFPDGYHGNTISSGVSSATNTNSTAKKKPGFFARLFGRGAQ